MTVKISKPAINVREELADLRKPTGIAGEAMLRAETPQEQFNLIGAGRRNLIINGDQRIAQRGTSATGVVGSGYYINDRMHLGCSTNASGTYTLSQSTDAPARFKNSFKLDCTTANSTPNQLRFNYSVEGNDVSHLNYGSDNAQTLTLSFWVKSNVTGTYTLSIETSTAQRYFASHYTIDTANTWEYKTIQIVGDTANTISTTNVVGLTLSFWLASPSSLKQGEAPNGWTTNSSYTTIVGSDFNVNMASSTSNEWMITGIQLELGKVATPFEHRSYGEELALCQRYYQVGTFVGNGGTDLGDTNPTVSWMPQTAMRATASMGVRDDNAAVNRYTDPTSGSVSWVYGGPSHRADNISFSGSYANGIDQGLFVLDLGNTSSGVGSWIRFHWYADAEL
jgi:hypothetical protein